MTDETWRRIAQTLSSWRARADLTQQEFADRAGVSLSVVSRLEAGHPPASDFAPRTIARVAQALPKAVGQVIVTELGHDPSFLVFADDSDSAREKLGGLVDRLSDAELDHVRRHIEWVIAQRE